MSKWRRFPMIVLAMWASLALTLPTLVWSCPMSGRLSVTAPVCAEPKAAASEVTPAHPSCCPQHSASSSEVIAPDCQPQSVPLPQAPHEADLSAPASQNPTLSTAHAPQLATVFMRAPQLASPTFISHSFHAADPLQTQHSPPLESGRAPPF